MYPYSWTWLYTFLAVGFLLAVFLMGCTVLLLRKGTRGKWHRSPRSIATPLGHVPYDAPTRKIIAVGVARARQRNYAVRGNERE